MFTKKFDFAQLRKRRILCLGIGGGSDAISAFVCAQILKDIAVDIAYGNTKLNGNKDICLLSTHIGYVKSCEVPITKVRHGTTDIDSSLSRGSHHSPLIFLLDKQNPDIIEQLAREIIDLNHFDFIIGVDTGGDALKTKNAAKSRDVMMLKVLRATKLDSMLFVLGMASDGISPHKLKPRLKNLCSSNSYLGYFPLAPYQNMLNRCSLGLAASRTPKIILSALDSSSKEIKVKRGGYYTVQREWLVNGFVFNVNGVLQK
ncbi:DUF1152 domain-containing protein [Candidatus Uabimicrobium sp. HlEnr_7]|uniref:DUF1152 domain-containing protein n=1 Tax=Candidatus Uabimicrobium helgolandensis TaxID=3095367 RepID=UPI003557F086